MRRSASACGPAIAPAHDVPAEWAQGRDQAGKAGTADDVGDDSTERPNSPVITPGFAVIRAHKQAVRDKLAELLRADYPDLPGRDELADHLFLLLEGAVAQAGIDGTTDSVRQAERIARTLVSRSETGA